MCDQMRWITESANELQSTDEDKRRFAEQVEKLRKAMASVKKQATGQDLQRVADMEEGLKMLMDDTRTRQEEVRAKGAEDFCVTETSMVCLVMHSEIHSLWNKPTHVNDVLRNLSNGHVQHATLHPFLWDALH